MNKKAANGGEGRCRTAGQKKRSPESAAPMCTRIDPKCFPRFPSYRLLSEGVDVPRCINSNVLILIRAMIRIALSIAEDIFDGRGFLTEESYPIHVAENTICVFTWCSFVVYL